MTIVVDRASRELVGAAMACPDASAAIHECVVAIKARVTIDVLAETIHAFPSTSRILNGLFADACRELRSRAGLAATTRRSGLEDDAAVHQHHRGAGRRERAARLDGVVEAGRRDDDDVGALTDRQPAAVDLPRRRCRVDACRTNRPIERQGFRGSEGRRAGGPARIRATDGERDPRPRIERLDRRVGPERR